MNKQVLSITRSRLAIILLLILVAAGPGCKKGEVSGEKESSPASEKTEKSGEVKETGMVMLSPEKLKTAGIETKKVTPEPLSAMISATAVIEFNGDKFSKVSPRVSGRVAKILASQGDRVKAGQPLALLDSVELDQAWSDYVKARGRVELAKKNLEREETLFEKKISPEKDVMKAKQDRGEAEADLNLSTERFRLLGIDVADMEQRKNSTQDGNHPLIPLASAIGGAVIERTATPGEIVGPDKVLFTVADLTSLWAVIDIYEKDLGRVKSGTAVKVMVTAFPDKSFRGVISNLGDVVDEKTRTLKARVVVDNSSTLLKPGMFAAVNIEVKDATAEKVLMVPDDAILMDGEERFVFVQTGAETFERRVILPGRTSGKNVAVIEGLKQGDRVVVKGAFTLKSELKKDELAEE